MKSPAWTRRCANAEHLPALNSSARFIGGDHGPGPSQPRAHVRAARARLPAQRAAPGGGESEIRRADRYQMEHDRAVHEFEMRSFYERGASSQSGILGALVFGLLLAAVGAVAWWSGASATCCGWSAGAASRPSRRSRSPAATRGCASSHERVGAGWVNCSISYSARRGPAHRREHLRRQQFDRLCHLRVWQAADVDLA
jgi:hypothetical protein